MTVEAIQSLSVDLAVLSTSATTAGTCCPVGVQDFVGGRRSVAVHVELVEDERRFPGNFPGPSGDRGNASPEASAPARTPQQQRGLHRGYSVQRWQTPHGSEFSAGIDVSGMQNPGPSMFSA
ncbi:hypothetical protein T261_8157 [Streptomyces lydicus]|nr:hypothetical protein T261_8157 [Streptomyces lydicus]